MKRLVHPCATYRKRLSLLACGALSESEQGGAEQHLSECASCQEYLDELKRVTAPLATWEGPLTQIEPSPAARLRWARGIQTAKAPQPTQSLPMRFTLRVLWRELIWPCRRAWTGMAALWLVMLWINLGASDHRATSLTASSKPAPGTWQALEEQRRLLAELIPTATGQPKEPRGREPGPRSERSGARTAMSASNCLLACADTAVRVPSDGSRRV